MRNVVTTLIFAGASLLGTAGIVTYADPAVAATPAIALHAAPAATAGSREAYAAAQLPLDQQGARLVRTAAR
jgi:hypothetical protein